MRPILHSVFVCSWIKYVVHCLVSQSLVGIGVGVAVILRLYPLQQNAWVFKFGNSCTYPKRSVFIYVVSINIIKVTIRFGFFAHGWIDSAHFFKVLWVATEGNPDAMWFRQSCNSNPLAPCSLKSASLYEHLLSLGLKYLQWISSETFSLLKEWRSLKNSIGSTGWKKISEGADAPYTVTIVCSWYSLVYKSAGQLLS